MSIRCRLGIHRRKSTSKFIPSISAEILEEYIYEIKCERCNKQLYYDHEIWNKDTKQFDRKE